MDKCSHCYIVDRAKLAYCPDCKKVKKKTGKEILIDYCQKHTAEEVYNFLKRLFDESMNWTDSRGFIIQWLEEEQE